MDSKTYTITLADGTVLDNLKLNGNNFISNTPINADIFNENCSPIIISDGVNSETYNNMELVQITEQEPGKYWFVLRELSASELAIELARNYTNEKINSLPSNAPTKTVTFDGGIYSVGSDVVNGQVSVTLKGNTWTNRAGIGDTSPQTIENLDSAKTYLLIKTDGGTVNVDAVDTAVPAKITGKTSTVLTWASGKIALYELSAEEAALDVAVLGQKYHYISGTKSTNSVRVKSVGKNLWDGKWEFGGIDGSSGEFLASTVWRRTKVIKCVGGEEYKMSGGNRSNWRFEDINGNLIGYATTSTIIAPINAYKMYVYFSNGDSGTYDNIQIEKGTIATEHEPYKESIVNVNLPEPLRSLPNGVKDEVNVVSGVETQGVGEVILDGSSGWINLNSSYENTYRMSLVGWILNNNVFVASGGASFKSVRECNDDTPYNLSVHGASFDVAISDVRAIGPYLVNNQIMVRIEKTKVDAMEGATITDKFKAYLNQYPITLTYQLATPIVTKLPTQAPLQVFENGTVYVEPIGDPSESTLPTVELTVPIGAPNKFGSALHDYEGAAADWVLNDSEQKCLILVATNSGGNANIILPKKSGLVYLVDNKTDYNIVCKSVGDVAGTTILSGNSGLIYNI